MSPLIFALLLPLWLVALLMAAARRGENVLRLGTAGSGKTIATAFSVANCTDAQVILDPHPDGLVSEVLPHVTGNVLVDDLSDLGHSLGYEMLVPSRHPDPLRREAENQAAAEAFVEILLRRRGGDLGSRPLMEEYVYACILCYLNQRDHRGKTPELIPYLLAPDSEEYESLLAGCTDRQSRSKLGALRKMTPKGLRGEVGSSGRLLTSVFRSPHFRPRCRGTFRLGPHLAGGGKLLVERGRGVGDGPMAVAMGAVILLTRAYAESREGPLPTVRLRIDEAANADLLSDRELRIAAECNKWGLYLEVNLQRDPGGGLLEDLLQLCHRHEFYKCNDRALARKAAVDLDAGLPPVGDDETRAQRVERLTAQLMNLRPGERAVRDAAGTRFERVPMLDNPWPDWPGLRDAKRKELLCRIHARPEYRVPPPSGGPDEPPSSNSSGGGGPPPPNRSPGDSSAAGRWRRDSGGPAGGS
jgi:hypothetical protein